MRALMIREDVSPGEVRRLAKTEEKARVARRLLAIAAALDGLSREAAARIAGMHRQTLRDWAIRYNRGGPEGYRAAGAGPGGGWCLDLAAGRPLTKLRPENHRLRQERDILAKAGAWFAREKAPSGSSNSCARTRPNSPLPPWPASSASRPPATVRGAAARPWPVPRATQRCRAGSARFMPRRAAREHLAREFAPVTTRGADGSTAAVCPSIASRSRR